MRPFGPIRHCCIHLAIFVTEETKKPKNQNQKTKKPKSAFIWPNPSLQSCNHLGFSVTDFDYDPPADRSGSGSMPTLSAPLTRQAKRFCEFRHRIDAVIYSNPSSQRLHPFEQTCHWQCGRVFHQEGLRPVLRICRKLLALLQATSSLKHRALSMLQRWHSILQVCHWLKRRHPFLPA